MAKPRGTERGVDLGDLSIALPIRPAVAVITPPTPVEVRAVSIPFEVLALLQVNRTPTSANSSLHIGIRETFSTGANGNFSAFVDLAFGDLLDVSGEDHNTAYMDTFIESGGFWPGTARTAAIAALGAQWFWMRVRFEADRVKGKAWVDGTSEPASWTVTAIKNSFQTALDGANFHYLEFGMGPQFDGTIRCRSLEITEGYGTPIADLFDRVVTDGLGESPISGNDWAAVSGDVTSMDVDGSEAVCTGGTGGATMLLEL